MLSCQRVIRVERHGRIVERSDLHCGGTAVRKSDPKQIANRHAGVLGHLFAADGEDELVAMLAVRVARFDPLLLLVPGRHPLDRGLESGDDLSLAEGEYEWIAAGGGIEFRPIIERTAVVDVNRIAALGVLHASSFCRAFFSTPRKGRAGRSDPEVRQKCNILHSQLYEQYTAPALSNLKESRVTKVQEEIRNGVNGRSLALVRAVAGSLRALDWTVRESAEHSAGIADLAATLTTERKGLATRVHLVIRCHSGSRVLFSEAAREVDDSVASYSIADDDRHQRRALAELLGDHPLEMPAHRPAIAPRARAHAASFRGDDAFLLAVDDAFLSIDAVLHDLFAHDLDAGGNAAELLAPLVRQRALVHAAVLTDAPLTLLGERLTERDSIRLHRTRVVEAGGGWVDVVGAEGVGRWAAGVTKHYGTIR